MPWRAILPFLTICTSATAALAAVQHGHLDVTVLNNTNLNLESPDPALSANLQRTTGEAKVLTQTNKADYHLEFESAGSDDMTLGVLIGNISVLADDYSATIIPLDPMSDYAIPGPNYPVSTTAYNTSFQFSGVNSDLAGSYFLSINNASGSTTGNVEYTSDVDYAFFPYANYLSGFADTRGGLNDGPRADPVDLLYGAGTTGLSLVTELDLLLLPNPGDYLDTSGTINTGRSGNEFIDVEVTGEYLLDMTALIAPTAPNQSTPASNQNGVLLTVNGGNSNEIIATRSNPDGTFSLFNYDLDGPPDPAFPVGSDNPFKPNPVAFAYVPLDDAETAAVGRVDAEGDVLVGSGNFSVTKLTMLDGETVDGTYLLQIPGEKFDSGTLIVSPESDGTQDGTQFLMREYRGDLDGWVVQTRAVPTATLVDLPADSPLFSFAFFETPGLGIPGDFNDDGVVNTADYTVWRDNLGGSFDLNGNGDESGGSAGVVDSADYMLWKNSFGATTASTLLESDVAVPEPASTALFLFGSLAASRAARRR